MNLDLRQAVLQNVKGKTAQDLQQLIEKSVGGEEKALPGLGILFEVIWQGSDPSTRQEMTSILQQQLVQ